MKKTIAFLLSLAMLLALCACGASNSAAPAAEAEPAEAPTEAEETATEAAPAEEEAAAEEAPAADAKVLTVAMGFPENDSICVGLKYFCDYVEEATNGSVTFEYYWGGSLCSVPECFDYVSNGTIDLTAPLRDASMEKIPLYGWWTFYVSPEDSIALANYIQYENEETAPLVEQQLIDNNVITFGWSTAGNNAFASTKDIANGFADMANMSFGSGINTAIMAEVGVTSQPVSESEFYESLSRGIVDCTSTGLAGICTGKLYEVAPYIMVSGTSNAICNITLNRDVWNSLTEDEQAAFYEASEAFQKFTLENYNNSYDSYIQEIEDSGSTLYYMSDEDNANYAKAYLSASYASYKDFAANLGLAEEYETIANAINEYCGFSING